MLADERFVSCRGFRLIRRKGRKEMKIQSPGTPLLRNCQPPLTVELLLPAGSAFLRRRQQGKKPGPKIGTNREVHLPSDEVNRDPMKRPVARYGAVPGKTASRSPARVRARAFAHPVPQQRQSKKQYPGRAGFESNKRVLRQYAPRLLHIRWGGNHCSSISIARLYHNIFLFPLS